MNNVLWNNFIVSFCQFCLATVSDGLRGWSRWFHSYCTVDWVPGVLVPSAHPLPQQPHLFLSTSTPGGMSPPGPQPMAAQIPSYCQAAPLLWTLLLLIQAPPPAHSPSNLTAHLSLLLLPTLLFCNYSSKSPFLSVNPYGSLLHCMDQASPPPVVQQRLHTPSQ